MTTPEILEKTRAAKRLQTVSKRKLRRIEERNEQKYKMVRFVERRKIERKLKKCRTQLAAVLRGESTDETEEALRTQLRQVEEDRQYVRFFPARYPYISIFADLSDEARERRTAIQKIVNEAVLAKRKKLADDNEQEKEDDEFFEDDKPEKEKPNDTSKDFRSKKKETIEGETRDQRRWRLRMERKARETEDSTGKKSTEQKNESVPKKSSKQKNDSVPKDEEETREQRKLRLRRKRKAREEAAEEKKPTEVIKAAKKRVKRRKEVPDKTEVVKTSSPQNVQPDVHPTWQAAQSVQRKGCIVQAEANKSKKISFDSDSE